MIFYFFTRTNWDEPPRIRHQLARMLRRKGHEVIFFERPQRSGGSQIERTPEGVTLVGTREFLHHQLRPAAFLQRSSGMQARREILSAIHEHSLPPPDVFTRAIV